MCLCSKQDESGTLDEKTAIGAARTAHGERMDHIARHDAGAHRWRIAFPDVRVIIERSRHFSVLAPGPHRGCLRAWHLYRLQTGLIQLRCCRVVKPCGGASF